MTTTCVPIEKLAQPESLDELAKHARELRELDPFWEEL